VTCTVIELGKPTLGKLGKPTLRETRQTFPTESFEPSMSTSRCSLRCPSPVEAFRTFTLGNHISIVRYSNHRIEILKDEDLAQLVVALYISLFLTLNRDSKSIALLSILKHTSSRHSAIMTTSKSYVQDAPPNTHPFSVNGKTAIVTGAGSGMHISLCRFLLSLTSSLCIAGICNSTFWVPCTYFLTCEKASTTHSPASSSPAAATS
jgi:hypothetical protein